VIRPERWTIPQNYDLSVNWIAATLPPQNELFLLELLGHFLADFALCGTETGGIPIEQPTKVVL
jgi:hypothetical protein